MDPLTAATLFATVVSLLADFKAQRRDRSADEFNDFMTWLVQSNHSELADLLRQNVATAIGIKALLNEDRETLRARLDHLDRSLASLASAVDGFKELSIALRPEAQLSDQAISTLKQFDQSGGSHALEVRFDGRFFLKVMEGPQVEIEFSDLRFAEDDLASLVQLGLLRLTYNPAGTPIYVFTRRASELARGLRDA